MEWSSIKHRDSIICIPYCCKGNWKTNQTVLLYINVENEFKTPSTHYLGELVSAAKAG
jgi:hypothetical protein